MCNLTTSREIGQTQDAPHKTSTPLHGTKTNMAVEHRMSFHTFCIQIPSSRLICHWLSLVSTWHQVVIPLTLEVHQDIIQI